MSRLLRPPDNDEVADVLDRIADRLDAQHASSFRVRAYRRGAETVRGQQRPVAAVVGAGHDRLEDLPAIGRSLARTIREYVATGRVRFLESLEGHAPAEEPGQIEGRDGDALDAVLRDAARRCARAVATTDAPPTPPVALLLDVDREYRERAARGALRTIAPRRENPDHEAWLPILHLERGGWSLTALFSNTARAHELGRTHDWVVVYYESEAAEGRSTVVTEYSGRRKGRRVVRGREDECDAVD